VQGVFGDKLPKRFATEMAFYAEGKPLPADFAPTKKHAVVFVHGSADTEHGWNVKPGELNFGERLSHDFPVETLYLRYNSGLAVSENGERLSKVLADLARHKSLRSITLIAHSMGGLVAHSAIYHARAMAHGGAWARSATDGIDERAQHMAWLKKLKQVFLLGTPHAGAPLAQIAEKGEQILQFIPNPFTLIAASVIGLRSRGLKDLSRGQKGLPAEGSILQQGVKYVFIAGGVQKKASGVMNRLIGDGMVRSQSAVLGGQGDIPWHKRAFQWLKKSAEVRVENLPGINHLALRTSPQVYAVIQNHFKP
jgi:triacylglycerol lipase